MPAQKPKPRRSRIASGIGGDSTGVDPTENVKALTEAASLRQDDLREAHDALTKAELFRVEQVCNIRSEWQRNVMLLQTEHDRELRKMESDRLDKIRQVDVSNAASTAAQLLSAVQTLASTAQATAETLRNQVAATAAAVANQTERQVNPIIERIAVLEKSSYTGQGRQAVADPQLVELIAEMKKMGVSASIGKGEGQGMSSLVGWIFGAIGTIGAIVSIGVMLTK